MHGAANTALGASLHIFGRCMLQSMKVSSVAAIFTCVILDCNAVLGRSVAIVWGQTTLKVAQLILETSSCKNTWVVAIGPGERAPQW